MKKRGGFVLIFILLSSFFLGSVASAQASDPYNPGPSNEVVVSNEGVSAGQESVSETPSGALAFTGGDVLGLVVIAGVLIAAGSVIVSRRRATVDA